MHYYQFNIGDFISATVHLSPMEELAYRRLLDMYYDTELPIPLETESVSRRLRLGSDVVSNVLKEYFYECEDGWRNERCDAEIAAYRRKADQARINGKLGGRRHKTEQVPTKNQSGSNSLTESKANHKPLTKNHNKPPLPPTGGFARFWETWPSSPRKVGKSKCAEKWRRLNLDAIADQIIAHISAMKESKQWLNGYEPAPMTYLNQRRWEDGLDQPIKAIETPEEFARRMTA